MAKSVLVAVLLDGYWEWKQMDYVALSVIVQLHGQPFVEPWSCGRWNLCVLLLSLVKTKHYQKKTFSSRALKWREFSDVQTCIYNKQCFLTSSLKQQQKMRKRKKKKKHCQLPKGESIVRHTSLTVLPTCQWARLRFRKLWLSLGWNHPEK